MSAQAVDSCTRLRSRFKGQRLKVKSHVCMIIDAVMAEGKAPKPKRLTVEVLEDSFESEDGSGDGSSSDASSADSQLVSV